MELAPACAALSTPQSKNAEPFLGGSARCGWAASGFDRRQQFVEFVLDGLDLALRRRVGDGLHEEPDAGDVDFVDDGGFKDPEMPKMRGKSGKKGLIVQKDV